MALLKQFFVWGMLLSFAFAQTPEQELIVKVLKLISIKNVPVVVYEHNPSISLQGSTFTNLAGQCSHADIVYGSNFETLPQPCKSLPRFSTDYEIFQKDEYVIGSFYWRKGRPQLRFDKERCDRFEIFLPEELVRYVQ
ncbi:hypothetical protein [Sulfurospirillum arsenophilum]|uniref:hypothetical protein n=1 Tax=Sulfurospirillum arsenophilum TaxID=56698 RepID=UPI0005A984FD|nr:hypothetical protein [Sulfurospirillum arsenophilum]